VNRADFSAGGRVRATLFQTRKATFSYLRGIMPVRRESVPVNGRMAKPFADAVAVQRTQGVLECVVPFDLSAFFRTTIAGPANGQP